MAKKQVTEIVPLAETMGLEKLSEIFTDLIGAVNEMLESGKSEAEDMSLVAEKAKTALTGPERVDQLVALLNVHEFQAALLRKAVQQAEKRARSHEAFVKSIKGSIELYMLESGIARIEGFAHRLAIYKQPDQLDITNEDLIPAEYFDEIPCTQKILDKEKLAKALQGGKEIPGVEYYTNRKRIDVK